MVAASLMKKYNIPIENVIRHYDVTGKICPEPFVNNKSAWANFKRKLTEEGPMDQSTFNIMFNNAMEQYRTLLQDNDSETWSKEARDWAVQSGLFNGSGVLPNGKPNYGWQDLITREAVATLFYRFSQKNGLI